MGYCIKCGKTMEDKNFYKSWNVEKFPPSGRMNMCKSCLTMHVDNWDPETYKWILEEADVPYIKEEWNKLLEKYGKDPKKIDGTTIIGRYLGKMKLSQFKKFRWADTKQLEQESREKKIASMQAQGLDEEEIKTQLEIDRTPEKPKELAYRQQVVETSFPDEPFDEFADEITEEERKYLQLKWGRGYRVEEWIRMEQLYDDMMKSYDIQSAGHKDTLIMICKASLKVNQCLDGGDIENAQKMAKVYDSLMKSGRFTAAQNKDESGEAVDSIGELVAICEKDKFIPKFYIDSPNDKVDRVIQDMQFYTNDLVRGELGLGNLIENSIKALEREREKIAAAANSDPNNPINEDELFDYETPLLTDEDYEDFFGLQDEEEDELNESTEFT